MPQNFVETAEKRAVTAWIPVIGFVMMIVIAILSYLLAPAFHGWLTDAEWVLAGTKILPLTFPGAWSDETIRLVVAGMLWLGLFAITMFVLLLTMGSPLKEDDVSLSQIRKEKEKELGRKIRK
jgi:hypothetical protein